MFFSTTVDELHQYRIGILKESIHLLKKYLRASCHEKGVDFDGVIALLRERANECAVASGIQPFTTPGGIFDDDAIKTGDRCFEVSKVGLQKC